MFSLEMIWIPITVVAAGAQCLRTALQRQLAGCIGNFAATYVRYLFGAPIAFLSLVAYSKSKGFDLPTPSSSFLFWVSLAGFSQVLGTWCLLEVFKLRNFIVGTLFSKTETLLVALLAVAFLGEHLEFLSWAGIGLSSIGVVMIAGRDARLGNLSANGIALAGWLRPTAMGLSAGILFAVCAVSVRAAANISFVDDFFLTALFTLATMTTLQFIVLSIYSLIFDKTIFGRIFEEWRWALPVGVLSVLGSLGWFTAIAMETPARVYAVGQVEILFSLFISKYYFKELISWREFAGGAMILIGILGLFASRH